MHVEVRLKD